MNSTSKITRSKLKYIICCDALHPTQQLFSLIGTSSCLLVLKKFKHRIKYLAQWQNTVTRVSLKQATSNPKCNPLRNEPLPHSWRFRLYLHCYWYVYNSPLFLSNSQSVYQSLCWWASTHAERNPSATDIPNYNILLGYLFT